MKLTKSLAELDAAADEMLAKSKAAKLLVSFMSYSSFS